ncbi:MAG: PLP-dependent aminotransferase family protein [Planctomycetota bacterium]|jgi:hypothetical protein
MSVRRLRFLVIYAIVLLVLVELTCRLVWRISGVSFLATPNRIHHFFYPELKPVEEAASTRDDGTYDVLALGGSVLEFGSFDEQLTASLEERYRRPVRVHSLARAAHTSLDSFYKYRRLHGQRFDLVVFYHGINEARANNCPKELFRDDYSHWGWYRLIADYENGGDRLFVLPYTLNFAYTKIGGKTGLIKFVPKHRPGEEWLVHGATIRTERTLRANLDRIREIAAARGDPLLVMTFATHVVEGYTLDKFRAGELDYAGREMPLDLWGKPEFVLRAIAVHNRVVREIAARPDVHLVDLQAEMPGGRRYFLDVCHLTGEGLGAFVANLVRGIEKHGLGPR